jgi:GntR family transcriptional repressor for pyruvate dehydrogenase complex
MVSQASTLATKIPGRIFFPGGSASLSSQIIADVRDALFAKKLKPGDSIGTENEIAARYGVSRIVARDALRTLQALGIAEIKMGKGGGARVARGNPRLFAEALAVQLDLTGVSPAEIMDAQRAIECLAAELAAENATDDDIARLRQSIADADASMGDVARFTQLGAEFHLAVAEASHNRVLVVQLISLQHVSWPRRNPTLTRNVMRRIQDVHKELLGLIEIRDAAGARRMMDDHVKMIRARRVSEHASQRSFRGRPKAGTRNPERDSELASGFRVRTFGAPRNDGGEDEAGCC